MWKTIKKIFNKRTTIMVVPHEYSSVKKIKLPSVVFILLIFVSLPLVYFSAYIVYTAVDYESVKIQNKILSNKVPDLQNTVDKLKKLEDVLMKKIGMSSNRELLEDNEKLIDIGNSQQMQKNAPDTNLEQIKNDLKKVKDAAREIQGFLNERMDTYNSIPRGNPTFNSEISSYFGKRSINDLGGDNYKFHKGVDIASSYGESVRATAPGVVNYADWDKGYGNLVVISHKNGFSTLYAHNSKLIVKAGDRVKKGDIIAKVGSTGHSTAPHVHYEVRLNGKPINPEKLFYDMDEEVMKYVF